MSTVYLYHGITGLKGEKEKFSSKIYFSHEIAKEFCFFFKQTERMKFPADKKGVE